MLETFEKSSTFSYVLRFLSLGNMTSTIENCKLVFEESRFGHGYWEARASRRFLEPQIVCRPSHWHQLDNETLLGQAPPPRIPVPKKVGRKWNYSTYQKKMPTFAILQQGLASENSVCRERSIKIWTSHNFNLAAGAFSAANPPPDSSLRSMFLNLSPSMYFAQWFPATRPETTQSKRELPPKRLLPWTPPATSPGA